MQNCTFPGVGWHGGYWLFCAVLSNPVQWDFITVYDTDNDELLIIHDVYK